MDISNQENAQTLLVPFTIILIGQNAYGFIQTQIFAFIIPLYMIAALSYFPEGNHH